MTRRAKLVEPAPAPSRSGKCPRCEIRRATAPHACPLQEELYNDHDPEHCICCSVCEQECKDDI